MKKQNHFINYMKGIAILMVVLTHMSWSDRSNPIFPYLIQMAVPIFMLISGMNYALSNQRKGFHSVRSLYTLPQIWHRIRPMAEPLFFLYIIEIVTIEITNPAKLGSGKAERIWNIFYHYFLGGYTKYGSYYFPVMVEVILFYPLLYCLVAYLRGKGVILVAVLNLLYESMVTVTDMPGSLYRLLGFRYMLYLAFGTWMGLYGEEFMQNGIRWKQAVLLLAIPVGANYVYLNWYTDYSFFTFEYWLATSMMTAFYFFPIFFLGSHYLKDLELKNPPARLLEKIGQKTWFIMLSQMYWYQFIVGRIYDGVPMGLQLLINEVVAVSAGFLFCAAYNRILTPTLQNILVPFEQSFLLPMVRKVLNVLTRICPQIRIFTALRKRSNSVARHERG